MSKLDIIKDRVEALFGENTFVVEDEVLGYIVLSGSVHLLLRLTDEEDQRAIVHFRAGLTPRMTSLLILELYDILDVLIGSYFDFDDEGGWLWGEKAVAHAAENIHTYWFGDGFKDEVEPYVEVEQISESGKMGAFVNQKREKTIIH